MSRTAYTVMFVTAFLAAGAAPAATLGLGSAAIPAQAAVSVPITVDPQGVPIAVLVVRIAYDPAKAAFIEAAIGPAAGGKGLAAHDAGGSVTLVLYGGPAIGNSGIAVQAIFDTHAASGTAISLDASASDASSEAASEVPLTITNGTLDLTENTGHHSADFDHDWQVSLGELLRVVAFFEAGAVHCDEATQDGFAPGPGSQNCTPHSSDYAPQDGRIGLEEVLRLIQLRNADGGHYHVSAPGEDGFAPGPFE